MYLETFGCQMNLSDSEVISRILEEAGYRIVPRAEEADVVLLNTCAVREHAEERVIGRLTQLGGLKGRRPDTVLGVCGCMAKHMANEVLERVPQVDLVLGPDSYRRLPTLIEAASDGPALDVRLDRAERYLGLDPVRKGGTNAWVTIMRGCDKFCTFCIVPYVRGRERAVPAPQVLRQVRRAARNGYQEVTLLGQTVNSYRDGEHDFADLLKAVAGVDGVRRIRFVSPHPADFSEGLVRTMAEEDKVCPFVHLPVQSGSDAILAAMGRTYTRAEYMDLVGRLRGAVPGLCLSTDIIVGFPGESESDFGATLDLLRCVRYDSAFMFKYSPRNGTLAQRSMPDTVAEEEKGRRLETVIALQNRISEEINLGHVGRVLEVLVEGDARKGMGQAAGKTGGFKRVVFPRNGAAVNTFADVEITGATSHTLTGVLAPARTEAV